MELKYNGKKIVAAVAQRPFIYGANTFCKLIPLFDPFVKDERVIDVRDFYNDGEIWWRLSSETDSKTIVPGMMMELQLEPSQDIHSTDPGKSVYQAKFLGKEEPIEPTAGAEVFRLPKETLKTLMKTKENGGEVTLPHAPAKEVYIEIDRYVYGPFSASLVSIRPGQTSGSFLLKAAPTPEGGRSLYRIRSEKFNERYTRLQAQIKVALDECGCRLSTLLKEVDYEYLAPDECLRLSSEFDKEWERLDWESLATKFQRLTNTVRMFSRAKKQTLKILLQDLEACALEGDLTDEFENSLQGVRKLADFEDETFRNLAVAVLDSEFCTDTRYTKVMKEHLTDYIQWHREEIEDQISALRRELKNLETKRQAEQTKFEREREQRKSEQKRETDRLKASLDKMREEAEAEIEAERQKVREECEREKGDLVENRKKIEGALEEIKVRTEKNAADCLMLFPFLKDLGMGTAKAAEAPRPESVPEPVAEKPRRKPFVLPESIHVPSEASRSVVAQRTFLDRVGEYAARLGLSYSAADLRRFHVSVLTEDLTVLEGPSGVGKSSLARLYGDMLAGEGAKEPRNGTLFVHVNPSWMEKTDLLGYVNTVTGEFSPSETGLYQRLLCAAADSRANGNGSAVYPICLDEMNLAQVEHYFGEFLQILEAPDGDRVVPCFSPESVSPEAVFRDYPAVSVSPCVRFIGTVNFDETTRRMSARLLDRTNLIYLNDQPRAQTTVGKAHAGSGVAYGSYVSWRRQAPLSTALESHLAALADPLRKLGATISPRVRKAMARYVATAVPLIGADEKAERTAFDEQIAQRVLSKVRSITSVAQKKALDTIAGIVDGFRVDENSPSSAALARLREKEHFFGYESES